MLRRIILALLLVGLGLAAIAMLVARQPPVVRRYAVTMADWPAGAPPLRLAFLSDTHVGSAIMSSARLDSVVAQVNALRPDCVLLGGDYLDSYPAEGEWRDPGPAVRPFTRLRPRLATFAVAGNHDELRKGDQGDGMRAALARAGVIVVDGTAARCGPLTVAGALGYAGVTKAVRSAATRPGPRLLLGHSPNVFMRKEAAAYPLVVAGHTHCGQIVLPLVGVVFTAGAPLRMACGLYREGGRVVIVGPGIGTTSLPLRLLTRPEILLIELRGRS